MGEQGNREAGKQGSGAIGEHSGRVAWSSGSRERESMSILTDITGCSLKSLSTSALEGIVFVDASAAIFTRSWGAFIYSCQVIKRNMRSTGATGGAGSKKKEEGAGTSIISQAARKFIYSCPEKSNRLAVYS